jgi:hypothetical protein
MIYRFYINNELVHEPKNWSSEKVNLTRSKTYWGTQVEASFDEVIFTKIVSRSIPNGYDVLKGLFDANGINATALLKIEIYDEDLGDFTELDTFVIDFSDYKELYDVENGIAVSCQIISTSTWKAINDRGSLELNIGANQSVEQQAITPVSDVDVLVRSLPLQYNAILEADNSNFGTPPDTTYYVFSNTRLNVAPIKLINNNIDFVGGQLYNRVNISDLNNDSVPISNYYMRILSPNMIIRDCQFEGVINIDYDYEIEMFIGIVGDYRISVYSLEFSPSSGYFNLSNVSSDIHNVSTTGTQILTESGTFTFNAQIGKYYFIAFDFFSSITGLIAPSNEPFFKFDVSLKYFEISDDTKHKAYTLKNCFLSLARQITGVNDILDADLLDTFPYNRVYITNGELLRNAETMDGVKPDLTLTFQKLFSHVSKWKPIGMIIENNKIKIVERDSLFGTNEIEFDVKELEISLANELIYNSVKVGNTRIKYEEINGTEEFNTTLEFSNILRCKENQLNLVVDYNDDYLGVELARRLGFKENQNEDTKYDDKVFFLFCFDNSGVITTQRFTTFENYVFPDYIYNAPFTPKRKLLNNSDLIKASLWKTPSDLRFEKIENQANLKSTIFSEPQIVERDNVEFDDMREPKFVPLFYSAEVGEREIYKFLKNTNNYFTFVHKGLKYSGYLWDTDFSNNKGTLKLLAKND